MKTLFGMKVDGFRAVQTEDVVRRLVLDALVGFEYSSEDELAP
jgi:hypothetical protein